MKNLLPLLLSITLFACSSGKEDDENGSPEKESASGQTENPSTDKEMESFTLDFDGNDVVVNILPSTGKKIGTAILLHGWNLPSTEWCEETKICDRLRQEGFTVVLPDHGKSTYQWQNYPETIEKYRPYPTREWMYNTEFEKLKEIGLLKEEEFNAVLGLSTGGRGAALFALENPDLFDVCVSLSADFDQTKLGDEPINTGFYGSYAEFPERWEGKDNIHHRADEFEIPILIAHGAEDRMCKPVHSEDFYLHLDTLKPDLEKNLVIKLYATHDYLFWGGMTDDIMAFINRIKGLEK